MASETTTERAESGYYEKNIKAYGNYCIVTERNQFYEWHQYTSLFQTNQDGTYKKLGSIQAILTEYIEYVIGGFDNLTIDKNTWNKLGKAGTTMTYKAKISILNSACKLKKHRIKKFFSDYYTTLEFEYDNTDAGDY